MMKYFLKKIVRRAGFDIVNMDRIGVDVETDLVRLTAHSPPTVMFDVGANFGQTALRFVSAFPTATVFSFEPVPSTFDRLRDATRHLGKVKIFNFALGETESTAAMHLAKSAGSNSLQAVPDENGTVSVQLRRLDRFMESNGISRVDLLKIDVEGHELQVLRGAGEYLQSGLIQYIYAECVVGLRGENNHTDFFQLHKLLDSAGYAFFNYYPQSFSLKLGSAMGNVLYIHRSHLPKSVGGNVQNIL